MNRHQELLRTHIECHLSRTLSKYMNKASDLLKVSFIYHLLPHTCHSFKLHRERQTVETLNSLLIYPVLKVYVTLSEQIVLTYQHHIYGSILCNTSRNISCFVINKFASAAIHTTSYLRVLLKDIPESG